MTQSAANSMQILLVEDEADARKAIARFLEDRGHRVETAVTAQEALASAAATMPDVVVCDWRLGDDDGVDVVRRLKQDRKLVAILMTASSLTELRSAAEDLEILSFLRKPVTLERIASEIERARHS
jgi:CheY-like chemotaxis protein